VVSTTFIRDILIGEADIASFSCYSKPPALAGGAFTLFGAVFEKAGIGRFIIDLSLALAGWSTGGPAKVTVIASGLMGTVSGSSVANTCTTGMFTIPLMKSVGYRPHFAGAVEAVASTGGQIMPPVMEAGAFIMAQFLGENYLVVAVAAIVPALLYYMVVMIQVHLEAQRLGLKGISRENLPAALPLLKQKGFLLIPLIAIMYFLLAGYTPLKAAFYGIIVCVALASKGYVMSICVVALSVLYFMIEKMPLPQAAAYTAVLALAAFWPSKERQLSPKILFGAFESGARSALSVACAYACVGMVVGMGTLTGLALRIAGAIIDLAAALPLPTLLATLLLTMCAIIFLGTGAPHDGELHRNQYHGGSRSATTRCAADRGVYVRVLFRNRGRPYPARGARRVCRRGHSQG
jgi:TRAP transporter 4TM/12TM fusion protein